MRIAITGLGAITPLGIDFSETWNKLISGGTGTRILSSEEKKFYKLSDTSEFLAAPVESNLSEFISTKQIRQNDRATQLALIAAKEAVADSNLDQHQYDPFALAVCFSPGLGNISTICQAWDSLREHPGKRLNPLTVPMLMPNAAASAIAIAHNARSGAHAPVSACSSGAEAIYYGANILQSTDAQMVIVGGTDAGIHPLSLNAFGALRALSSNYTEPQTASRPFTESRDGFVLGEGACALVLEREEHAKKRRARIYGYLVGWGMTCDAFGVAPPDPTGKSQEMAITRALRVAKIDTADIAIVNPHATSTPAGDPVEAKILETNFSHSIITPTKSATGHLLGAAGAIEAAFCVKSLSTDIIPPTPTSDLPCSCNLHISTRSAQKITDFLQQEYNLKESDAQVTMQDERYIAAGKKSVFGLSLSFGFGGHNCAIIFEGCPN